jgi:hypothetical protein
MTLARVAALFLAAATLTSAGEPHLLLGDANFAVRVARDPASLTARYGHRFDTTAHIDSVQAKGMEFLGEEGLVDEFNQRWVPPPGYNDAPLENAFLKIGVGLLQRTRITPYRFWEPHPVLTHAPTRLISHDQTHACFEQTLPRQGAWGFRYRKTYTVNPARRQITILYELENLSLHPIEVDQYNHNWLALHPASAAHPWTISTSLTPSLPAILASQPPSPSLTFSHVPAEPRYFMKAQNSPSPESHTVVSDGRKTVRMLCHFPASRFALFTQGHLLAPEVFAHLRILPGESAQWKRTYQFFTGPGHFNTPL